MALLGRLRTRAKRMVGRVLTRPVPARLAKNFRKLDAEGREVLLASIQANYLNGWRGERNTPAHHEYLLADHLHTGLDGDRTKRIPWLDSVRRLQGLRVLDIGCGTGSSTVALAEQGARVTAIDIDEGALQVARDRCRIYRLDAKLECMNARDIGGFGTDAFDLVVFSHSLAQMTGAERLAALEGAWKVLPAGGLLAVIGAPNRLWYFDDHTSHLPFYNWLPNDLALRYSRFSPRSNFRELYTASDGATEEHFLRRGRGVSFHEFDLAVKPAAELKVVGSRHARRGLLGSGATQKYKAMLMAACPGIHEAFFNPSLELVIKRD